MKGLYKELKILSLTSNVKLAQTGRHETVTEEVPGSFPTRGTFLLKEFFSSLPSNTKITTSPTLCSMGKMVPLSFPTLLNKLKERMVVMC